MMSASATPFIARTGFRSELGTGRPVPVCQRQYLAVDGASRREADVQAVMNDSVWARGTDLVVGPGEKVELVAGLLKRGMAELGG